MAKIAPISGFPEWLPPIKRVEDALLERIKEIYRLHGFVPIETPAVELVDTLTSKGVVDREIYVVKRLQGEGDEEAELGLHFDLTVPFARYVAQHMSHLTFPFKRYQLQKVWRGDRPQRGRFREFYQFDIDTIARDELPLSCDAEVLTALIKALRALALGPFVMMVNNRKVLHGCYNFLGITDAGRRGAVIRAVDKLGKFGPEGVKKELAKEAGLDESAAARVLEFTAHKFKGSVASAGLGALPITDPAFEEGVREISAILELIPEELRDFVEVDLSLARGLDYYTGVVFEVQLTGHREFGTVASGGRYDNLASQFTSQKLPGVGGSIGVTRLMDLISTHGLKIGGETPENAVLVTVLSEAQRVRCNEVAEELRKAGLIAEVFFKSPKLGKQIDYAAAKGYGHVLFLSEDGKSVEVKSLTTKVQEPVTDLQAWAKSLR